MKKRPADGAATPAKKAKTSAQSIPELVSMIRGKLGGFEGDMKTTFTPLQETIANMKKKYLNTLLLVEVGYKYMFYGWDAYIASRHLNIRHFRKEGEPFEIASIPQQRLFYHVERLVRLGYEVGIVRQTENAALREAKSGLFGRDIAFICSPSTFITDDATVQSFQAPSDTSASLEDMGENGLIDASGPSAFGRTSSQPERLVVIAEAPKSKSETEICLMWISPTTLEPMSYETFMDTPLRKELETRMFKLSPVEIIINSDLSSFSRSIVFEREYCQGTDSDERPVPLSGQRARINTFTPEKYVGLAGLGKELLPDEPNSLAHQCLGVLQDFLQSFKLEQRLVESIKDTAKVHGSKTNMVLEYSTISNLDILKSAFCRTAGVFGASLQEKGSLYWLLNHAMTPFGARVLHKWCCSPLLSRVEIVKRQDAVAEIIEGPIGESLWKFRNRLFEHMPDMERLMFKCQQGIARPKEFIAAAKAFQKACRTVAAFAREGPFDKDADAAPRPSAELGSLTSELLLTSLTQFPCGSLHDVCSQYMEKVNGTAAAANDILQLFVPGTFVSVDELRATAKSVEKELQEHLEGEVRPTLRLNSLEYKTISQVEYLLDVPSEIVKRVPDDWVVVSRTKTHTRYHSPTIVEKVKQLAATRERTKLESERCWKIVLAEFATQGGRLCRAAIETLATLDCLFSIATTSKLPNYCRPTMVDSQVIQIVEGRHPMQEHLMGKAYIPNTLQIGGEKPYSCVITGPNMGGKSSLIRQVAVSVIMAQIGCYVPAASATLGVFDNIYVRMGARDSVMAGQSTFMVEMQETSDILKHATERSLVILDELGRGTSTHDGVAIAFATLRHFVERVRAVCLFVTHYPKICTLAAEYPAQCCAMFMSYLVADDHGQADQEGYTPPKIEFLYKLCEGVSPSSFGLNVARLAGIPNQVLQIAEAKSEEMKNYIMNTSS